MSDEIEAWLQNNYPNVEEVAQETRAFVKAILPDATEYLSVGYKMIMYKTSMAAKEWVVYVGPYDKHVNLGFMYGSTLHDPKGLLKGTGKTLRHVKVRERSDLEQDGVRALIEAAWDKAVQDPR